MTSLTTSACETGPHMARACEIDDVYHWQSLGQKLGDACDAAGESLPIM